MIEQINQKAIWALLNLIMPRPKFTIQSTRNTQIMIPYYLNHYIPVAIEMLKNKKVRFFIKSRIC